MEPQQPSLSLRRVASWIVLLIVGIVIGAAVGYQYGFNAAKAVVAKSNFGAAYVTPAVVNTMVGTVTDVGVNQLTLSYRSLDPFADSSLDERIVRVDSSTVILKPVAKDQKLFEAEVAAFTLATQHPTSTRPASGKAVQIPTAYTLTQVSFADIAEGDAVTVTSDENIKSAKEFSAKEIRIQPKTGAPI